MCLELLHEPKGHRAFFRRWCFLAAHRLKLGAHGKRLNLMSHLQGLVLWFLMVTLQRRDIEVAKAEEMLSF